MCTTPTVPEPSPTAAATRLLEPAPTSPRLASAHPLSRLRLGEPGAAGPKTGFPGLGGLGRRSPVDGGTAPKRSGTGLRRRGLPSLRIVFGVTGIVATVAVVTSLLVALPNNPAAPASTG